MQNIIDEFILSTRNLFESKDFIPLHAPIFRGNEKKYILETIESTMVSSVGGYVDEFEQKLSTYVNVPKTVAVVNGTAGLQVALKLVGVKAGDEVITQALTFVATANAIHHNHASPIFLDVDVDTMGLSPLALEKFLKENSEQRSDGTYNKETGRKIAACMPMHTFGFICRIEQIIEICKKYKIPVVEDAAEALGSFSNGKAAGTFGDVGVYSFNGNKIITSGGGGALVSENIDLMERAKHITNTSKAPHTYEYFHNDFGYNFRMPNLNAALACAQLEDINEKISTKVKLFNSYANKLDSLGINLLRKPNSTDVWNYWLFSIQLDKILDRDTFLSQTNKSGVMTRPIWTLLHKLPMYSTCQRDELNNSIELEKTIINIPSNPIHGEN